MSIAALDNWDAKVEEYFADLQAGIDGLKNAAPQTKEEQHETFLLKKQVVNTLGGSNSGAVHLRQFGTYTRRQ